MTELFIQSTLETLYMVMSSTAVAIALGLPLGFCLFLSAPGQCFASSNPLEIVGVEFGDQGLNQLPLRLKDRSHFATILDARALVVTLAAVAADPILA